MRAVEKSLAQNRLVYPDEEVLHQARLAIVRLQAAYNLTATRLLASASANITARDAASLAHEALYIGFPLVAEGWQRLGSAVPGQVSGCWLSWSGQWLLAFLVRSVAVDFLGRVSGCWFSWSGQWLLVFLVGSVAVGFLGQVSGCWLSWSGQWLTMSGVGSSWSGQWLLTLVPGQEVLLTFLVRSMAGNPSSWSGQWLLRLGSAVPGQVSGWQYLGRAVPGQVSGWQCLGWAVPGQVSSCHTARPCMRPATLEMFCSLPDQPQ